MKKKYVVFVAIVLACSLLVVLEGQDRNTEKIKLDKTKVTMTTPVPTTQALSIQASKQPATQAPKQQATQVPTTQKPISETPATEQGQTLSRELKKTPKTEQGQKPTTELRKTPTTEPVQTPATELKETPEEHGQTYADPQNPQPVNGKCIYVSKVHAKPGDQEVIVDVMVRNNPGILGMTLTIDYDDTALTLKKAENGEAVSDVLTFAAAKNLKDGCRFTWDGQGIAESDIKDGAVLRLTFEVAKDAAEGTYPVKFTYTEGDIVDNDLASLTLELKDGAVTVE